MKVFACDLDQTLIFSNKWTKIPQIKHGDIACVEEYEGRPASFMLKRSLEILRYISSVYRFVPVTTRTIEQFNRVQLINTHIPVAIVSNGGVVLVNGQLDEEWASRIERDMRAVSPLAEVEDTIRHLRKSKGFKRLVRADNLFLYIVMETAGFEATEINRLINPLEKMGWNVHINGKKIYIVPSCVSKGRALEYVKKKFGYSWIIAAGDSSLDVAMREHANVFLVPDHGKLAMKNRREDPINENRLKHGYDLLVMALHYLMM